MKRTYRFARPIGSVKCRLSGGRTVTVPIVPGILKHPRPDTLASVLRDPDTLRKYTLEALRHASWPVLRFFPREWLRDCLDEARLKPGRKAALMFLLS